MYKKSLLIASGLMTLNLDAIPAQAGEGDGSFAGFNAGVDAGYSFAMGKGVDGDTYRIKDLSKLSATLRLGYNFQFGSWILGANVFFDPMGKESNGDYDQDPVDGKLALKGGVADAKVQEGFDGDVKVNVKNAGEMGLQLLAGYAVNESFAFGVTAAIALGKNANSLSNEGTFHAPGTEVNGKYPQMKVAGNYNMKFENKRRYKVGAFGQYKLSDNLSLAFNYEYTLPYKRDKYTGSFNVTDANATDEQKNAMETAKTFMVTYAKARTERIKYSNHAVTVGIKYHF